MNEELEKWIASRPPKIQAMVRQHPPGEYLISPDAPYALTAPGTRVSIFSYNERRRYH